LTTNNNQTQRRETTMGTQIRKTVIAFAMSCALLLTLPTLAAAGGKQFTPWTDPVHLGEIINSSSQELTPELSPDGLSLYFGSNRPGVQGSPFDIWASRRACESCSWGAPVRLGRNVNSEGDEIAPAFSRDGRLLFFASDRTGSIGDTDIWVSRRKNKNDDFGWGPPVNLGPFVNTEGHETSPAFLPGKRGRSHTFYFVRGEEIGFDIYETKITKRGVPRRQGTPVAELNHPDPSVLDGDPGFRGDGRELIFYSGRDPTLGGLDIWVATRKNVHKPWSNLQNLGAPVNSTFADFTPGITFDGRTLFFAAGMGRGSLGLQDLWMSTRERICESDDRCSDDDDAD
jgi:dipeptidyl aminopeptidase/acylaminoacyl peptidase